MENIEKDNVFNVYDIIGKHFDKTRVIVWPSVKKYLDSLETNKKILEIGCGNGKNILYRPELKIIGCDTSKTFLNICKEKNINCFLCDQRNIISPDNNYDHLLSIAVFHHIFKYEERINAVKEMIRILRVNGTAMIQVWKFPLNSKTKMINESNDYFIEWENESDKKIYQRYYHRFENNEFTDLFNFSNIEILENYEDHNNLIIIFKKIE